VVHVCGISSPQFNEKIGEFIKGGVKKTEALIMMTEF